MQLARALRLPAQTVSHCCGVYSGWDLTQLHLLLCHQRYRLNQTQYIKIT